MPTTQPLPPKKEVALALLERSNDKGIYVHLDPRQAAVVVPPWFKKQPQLVLQIGLNMAIPIPDLRLDDEGMSCTLSFNRSPFFCVVPWAAVFAIVGDDARGMVWPDDVPAEIARHASSPQQQQPSLASRPSQGGPAVRAVETPPKREGKGPSARDAKGEGARAQSTNGAGGKKQKKRPPLAAVSDAEPPKAKNGRSENGARATNAAAAPPVVPVAPASKPALGAPRKKRELPPYLRVVK